MALTNLTIKKEYRNLQCDVINDFYIPVLKEAVLYKRAVGFFNSSALYEMAIGLKQLVLKNGKIRLIVSPHLTDEDIKAIRLGYKQRNEIIEAAILREIPEAVTKEECRRINLLANLIAENILDVKVAFKMDANSVGIFHEKIGIIEDFENNKVAFTGSMNETYSGLLLNYESIDVYCSWKSEDEERVQIKEQAFDRLWNNLDEAIEVLDFPKVAISRLQKYRVESNRILLDKITNENLEEKAKVFFKIPNGVKLHDYQTKAIEKWREQNYKGIFDMATGTGKTYTALGALSMFSEYFDSFAVVIICPYQHLVEQWVEDIELFNVKPIVAYSASSQKNWKEVLSDTINSYRAKVKKNFCVITTNATFVTDFFQKQIKKLKRNVCIVVDEAHNFGAESISNLMPEHIEYRLGLSATIERAGDEEGTDKIFHYFGDKCITYTLDEAIKNGFLTGYYYYPILVYLTPDELEGYKELSRKISKLVVINKNKKTKNSVADLLILKRARIVAGAKNKISKLLEVIKPYVDDNHMLVYCGATKYDRDDIDDEDQVRQIEEITRLLYQNHGMKVRKFTSDESKVDRQLIKEQFQMGEDLQVVTAIKCLDEGMNIPAIKRAFILASSTNPKEYIQRRGRVLRKFDGKEYAEIFDFITLPRPLEDVAFCDSVEKKYDLSLIKKELIRMMDFAKTARKSIRVDELKEKILSAYKLYNINLEDENYEQ